MCQVNAPQIDVIFQTSEFLILNKPYRCHFDEAVALCVSQSQREQKPEDWEAVHRLDYETSGCLLIAQKPVVLELRKLLQTGIIEKSYIAGATHRLGIEMLNENLHGFVGSRYRSSKKVRYFDARHIENLNQVKKKFHSWQPTQHRVIEARPSIEEIARQKLRFTGDLYEIELVSGARHQIRAFFAESAAPLVGDPIYGPGPGDEVEEIAESTSATTSGQGRPRLELHAYRLAFKNPFNGQFVEAISSSA